MNSDGADPPFASVKPPTLKEHVVQLLTDAIMSGRIKPGARLVETFLAEQFQVSRAPIREALHRLQEQGLAVSRPRHGIFVVDLQVEDLQKVNSLRLILEAEALRLCKAKLTPQVEKKLVDLVTKMESGGPSPAVDAMQVDLEFHRTIWHTSGNEYLEKILVGLTTPVFAKLVLLMPKEERLRKVVSSHRQLLEFIQGKLERSAEQVMLDLLSIRWPQPDRFSSLALNK